MASLGPMVSGYTLLLTKQHHSCCAAIPEDQLPEFTRLVDAIRSAQVTTYGSSLSFEHGRTGSCVTTGHGDDACFHAHLHFVPTSADLATEVRKDYPLHPLPDWSALLKTYSLDGAPYLLVQNGEELEYVAAPDRLPRQYLRTTLARLLGMSPLEDWMAFPSYDLVRTSVAEMSEALRATLPPTAGPGDPA
ncbi:hypothetical protein GCM10023148_05290 [Actinokineospora soli]